jgi:hypothetical protein
LITGHPGYRRGLGRDVFEADSPEEYLAMAVTLLNGRRWGQAFKNLRLAVDS